MIQIFVLESMVPKNIFFSLVQVIFSYERVRTANEHRLRN